MTTTPCPCSNRHCVHQQFEDELGEVNAVSVGKFDMSSKLSTPETTRPENPVEVENGLETTEGEQEGDAGPGSDPPTKMTMEERRAKLIQLRRKLVCVKLNLNIGQ
jgi:hypothetical protein